MAIDTQKNFKKNVGSLHKAAQLISSLLKGESLDCTTSMCGRRIHSAGGKQKTFNWYYNPTYKYVGVTYTDGRPQKEVNYKPEFFVVWIEGLSPERGEKIKTLDSFNHSYTTKMTEALRVKREDIQRVKDILRGRGVAGWALEGAGTFHKVRYAPKGTLFVL